MPGNVCVPIAIIPSNSITRSAVSLHPAPLSAGNLNIQLSYLCFPSLQVSILALEPRLQLGYLIFHFLLLLLPLVPQLLLLLCQGVVRSVSVLKTLVLVLQGVRQNLQLLVLRDQLPAMGEQVLRDPQTLFEVLFQDSNICVHIFEFFLRIIFHEPLLTPLIHQRILKGYLILPKFRPKNVYVCKKKRRGIIGIIDFIARVLGARQPAAINVICHRRYQVIQFPKSLLLQDISGTHWLLIKAATRSYLLPKHKFGVQRLRIDVEADDSAARHHPHSPCVFFLDLFPIHGC